MFSLMLFANVILELRNLVEKLNPVSLSLAHSKVEKENMPTSGTFLQPLMGLKEPQFLGPVFAGASFCWVSVSFEQNETGRDSLHGFFRPRERF